MLKKINEKELYKDNWVRFYQDEIEFPDGSKGTYAYAKRKNGVCVVVVSDQGKILLHKEHRYVINDYSWEVQGGGIDQNESVKEAAVRELKEEAGIDVSEELLTNLGAFYPLHSFNTELVTLFMVVVNNEVIRENGIELGEDIKSRHFFSFEEVLQMIDSGKINDAMTANAVQLAIRKFNS
ncbi:hypothetical protein C5B42_00925 [Candidatus Cerribacteria bacterium 'Amazon FNV 2010 28 9']|uniref:Nudix hydrolase domain-containing protein n=1 Tax=Candidatus Cerribacteria bacterium 'Amazon FNV 2010 28 9' TaxID=2081795 RepID=A0A317JTZ2_9BACT|nr:MAG: hypothetical protein C5B42_00925 [Candidatus Cerribacteria bacterium 'Amazon FNV 2010 28 9']